MPTCAKQRLDEKKNGRKKNHILKNQKFQSYVHFVHFYTDIVKIACNIVKNVNDDFF